MMTPKIEVRMPDGKLMELVVNEWSVEEDFIGVGKVYIPTKVEGLPAGARLIPVVGTDARYLVVME